MHKEVLYIDVEDDITAIIGKVKASKEKVVAIVPPKRIGVLQSAVNLKLLLRAAQNGQKHLVLITNNQSLVALAAAAKIPIAKNLQSKPELAEIPALSVDDEDDIIDGANLPIGDHARMTEPPEDDIIDGVNIEDDTPKAAPPMTGAKPFKPRVKSGIKVPSFDSFRKKLFIFGGLGVVAIGFLVWAIFFAGEATVVIDARTTNSEIKTSVAIGPTLSTDAEASTLKSVQMQDKQTATVDFDATGTEEVGEKATGTMEIKRTTISPSTLTIPVGTAFSSDNFTFLSTEAVVLDKTVPGEGVLIHDSATIRVQAQAIGAEFNLSARSYNANVAGISASGSAMTGGEKRQIKVVTQNDVVKATQQLSALKQDDAKKKLQDKFDDNTVVIADSFLATPAAPQSTPAVGEELKDAKAKLTSEVVYTMSGIAKGDLSAYLKKALETQLDSDEQRVYSDGLNGVKMTDFKQATGNNTTIALAATGKIGPKINDEEVKETVKGKKAGEIQTELKQIEGVNDVETKFSPFWVNTVPNDTKKIKIEFKIRNDS